MRESPSVTCSLSILFCTLVVDAIMMAFQWTHWTGFWSVVGDVISFWEAAAFWSALWFIGRGLWKKR